MALEIISEPTGSATGTFTPRADQKKHRSAWGVISGTGKSSGFTDGHTLRGGITTADGRRKLPFREFKEEKGGATHDITFNGQTLREFICDVDDATAKDLYDAGLSNERMNGYLAPVTVQNSSTQVGMQKSGELAQTQVPTTHQY